MADELPSIEAEFAELEGELARLAIMPVHTQEQHNTLVIALETLRDAWHKRAQAPDAPGWRRAAEEAVSTGFDGVLGEVRASAAEVSRGKVQLDSQMLQRHMRPALDALADGLRRNLVQKFRAPVAPGAEPPKVDAADVAGILLTLFAPPKKKP